MEAAGAVWVASEAREVPVPAMEILTSPVNVTATAMFLHQAQAARARDLARVLQGIVAVPRAQSKVQARVLAHLHHLAENPLEENPLTAKASAVNTRRSAKTTRTDLTESLVLVNASMSAFTIAMIIGCQGRQGRVRHVV